MGRRDRGTASGGAGAAPGGRDELPARHLRLALLAVVAASLVLSAWGALTDSITVDEGPHLASGYAALKLGDFRVNPEHPPLAKLWAALPLLARPSVWPGADEPAWREGRNAELAVRWLEELNDGQALVAPARLAMLAFPALLLAAVALAGRRLFGPAAGLAAGLVAALDPSLLAHGHLVTTDVPIAAAVLASLLALDRAVEEPSARRLALLAAAVALAAASKFSWLFLLPALAVEAALLGMRPRGDGSPPRIGGWKIAAALLVLAAGVWAGVWAAYGFRYAPYSEAADRFVLKPDKAAGRTASTTSEAWEIVTRDLVTGEERTGLVPRGVALARNLRLLPEPYLFGLAYADKRAQWRSSYLMERVSDRGSPLYFPIAFLVKTPLPTLLAAGLGAWWILRRRIPVRRRPLARSLLVFSAVYVAAAVAGHLNLGYRHLFPVLPVPWLLAGAGLARAWEGRGRIGAALLAAWLAAGTLWAAPRYLAFFNEAAGGRTNGWRWLADSNLDWGQDALRLREWAAREPGPVYLADDTTRPMPRGLGAARLLTEAAGSPYVAPGPGTWVVAVDVWLGIYEPLVREATWADPAFAANARRASEAASNPLLPAAARARAVRDTSLLRQARVLSRLRSRPPGERVGDAYLVFRLDAAEYEELSAF